MSSTQSIRKPIASTLKPSLSAPGFSFPGSSFKEARRIQQSFLSAPEKKALVWMSSRTPSWINSDSPDRDRPGSDGRSRRRLLVVKHKPHRAAACDLLPCRELAG